MGLRENSQDFSVDWRNFTSVLSTFCAMMIRVAPLRLLRFTMVFRIFSQLVESRWLRAGLSSLLAIGAVSGITLMQRQRLQQSSLSALTPQQQDQQEALYIKSLKYLPASGFGFNNLIADWTFLRSLQYLGDTAVRDVVGYGAAPAYFDVVSQRDPRFLEPYIFASGTLSYELGMPEESIKVLDRGLAALDPQLHPGAHTLWTMRAMDQLLLLGDAVGAADSYGKGAEWAKQSTDPEWQKDGVVLQRTSDFLRSNPDSTGVRIWAWSTVFAQAAVTGNVRTQGRAREELLKLGAVEGKDKDGMTVFMPPPPAPKVEPKPSPTASPTASPTVSP
jgi:tetratricopeptide (TPR) repeat protein